ncbi:Ankyrin repeat domain-containing protein 26 [Porphyridium purpureum]|uniref:Ankyrin repeat domain-containing protein 26 n=1 Tax=Porphyridium purpureum TaxID=35688 RepID=A0A5J4YR93_PORPP|nr:Ankyrin repeat domain-containing protein 26 [Porphyridium purpureum]|eukprot:POR8143..scf296_7
MSEQTTACRDVRLKECVGDNMAMQLMAYVRDGDVAGVRECLASSGHGMEASTQLANDAVLLASELGHNAVLRVLVEEQGLSVDVASVNTELTGLMLAAIHGHSAWVRTLLCNGANTEAQELRSGRTALLCAAEGGEHACVRALLEHGANVQARDRMGNSALHYLAWPSLWDRSLNIPTVRNKLDAAHWLLQYELPIDCVNTADMTPLSLAGTTPWPCGIARTMFEFLIRKGADINRDADQAHARTGLLCFARQNPNHVEDILIIHASRVNHCHKVQLSRFHSAGS